MKPARPIRTSSFSRIPRVPPRQPLPRRTQRIRRIWEGFPLPLAFGLAWGVLAGCGSGGDDSPSPTPNQTPTSVPTPPDETPTTTPECCSESPTPNTPSPTPTSTHPIESPDPTAEFFDQDGDGFSTSVDCDDSNPAVYPGAEEVCDGLDNSCDDVVDDQACVWRVQAGSSSSSPTGLSWDQAFLTLSDAMDRAEPGDQVWVARGQYLAPAPGAPVLTLEAGVEVYGGFEGTERTLEERPGLPAETVLEGDFDQSGGPSDGDSFHVVLGASNARLDGFIVQGGRAEGTDEGQSEGGGLYVAEVEALTLTNLLIQANRATSGGGLFLTRSSLTLEEVALVGNVALGTGGGIAAIGAPLSLVDAELRQNSADSGGGIGAIDSALSLERVLIQENLASTQGGGLSCVRSTVTGEGSTLEANDAVASGGGIFSSLSPLTLTQLRLSGNSAQRGGGLFVVGGSVSLRSSEVTDNAAQGQGGGIYGDAATVQLANVLLLGNTVASGGGALYTTSGFLGLQLATLTENDGGSGGGGIKGVTSQITLENSILWGNLTQGAEPELDAGMDSVLRITSSCVARHADGTVPPGVSSDPSNVLLDPELGSPFALADRNRDGLLEYYLRHAGLGGETADSPCVDAGENASATASGIAWTTLTTRTDGQPDETQVDLGRHY